MDIEFLARVSVRMPRGGWITVELVVESGANATGLDAAVAEMGGVEWRAHPLEELSVVGGSTLQPFLSDIQLALLGDTTQGIWLPRLSVLKGSAENGGDGRQAGVLGMEALRSIGAIVHLDLAREVGWLEW